MYNKFYFLHVPKTGGRFLKNTLIPYLSSNIKIIEGSDRHGGWDKEIDDNTYIFSVIREPLEVACSLYAHIIASKADILFKDSIAEIKIHLDKDAFISWISKSKQYHNIQSKNFLIGGPVFDNLYNYSIFGKIDEKTLDKRLNRINFLVDHKYLLNNLNNVVEKICTDLNIEKVIIESDTTTYANIGSLSLYNSLTDSDKTKLSEFFDIDYKIYNKLVD